MKDCVFCKILEGEIPCYKIYEDDFTLAFLDIAADSEAHTVVIPKTHYKSVITTDSSTLLRVIETCKKVGNHYVNDCGFDGYNIWNNCGESAGQSVMHVHFHVVPRRKNDNLVVSNLCVSGCNEQFDLARLQKKYQIKPEKLEVVDDSKAVVLYTDGACSGNPGPGGWAAILRFKGKEKVLSGGEAETTNNRMELLAVIQGLEAVNENVPVNVFSDSAYVVSAFKENWIGKWLKTNWKNSAGGPVQNKELWQRLLCLIENRTVTFNKVKGHSDNAFNNRCDSIAREEIKKLG